MCVACLQNLQMHPQIICSLDVDQQEMGDEPETEEHDEAAAACSILGFMCRLSIYKQLHWLTKAVKASETFTD